jgi:hypothetical protein
MLSSKVRSISSNSCTRAVMVTEFMYLTAGGVDEQGIDAVVRDLRESVSAKQIDSVQCG